MPGPKRQEGNGPRSIGFTYAAFEVAADALKRAGTLDKDKLREALAQTNLTTIVGPIEV